MRLRLSVLLLIVALAVGTTPAALLATNGYFLHGYGTQSKGMAGAGIAVHFGPTSPITNPAAIALGTGGFDLSIAAFNPNREYTVVGNPSGYPGTFGLYPGTVKSGSRLFPVPAVGYARNRGKLAFGLVAYGNGGMNTNYDFATFGSKPTGVNISQMFLAPAVAYKLDEHNAIGATAILAYQMFKAEGLKAFSAYSSNAGSLSDNDTDSSTGAGVRVGYLGSWKSFSLGASYQSRISMGTFSKYAGLFAEKGGFDVPANWTAGIGIKPTENLDIAVDVQQVFYSGVKSVGNPMLPNLMSSPLGAANGPGFGWNDITVVKAGLQYRGGGGWTWRGGYSHGDQPIPSSEMLFNILAPGVITGHASLGFSKEAGKGRFFDVAVTRALSNEISGPNVLEAPSAQTIKLKMDQWDITVGYSVKF